MRFNAAIGSKTKIMMVYAHSPGAARMRPAISTHSMFNQNPSINSTTPTIPGNNHRCMLQDIASVMKCASFLLVSITIRCPFCPADDYRD